MTKTNLNPETVVATWKNTFNGGSWVFNNRHQVITAAKAGDYPFFSWRGTLWWIGPDGKEVDTGVDANLYLDSGVGVTSRGPALVSAVPVKQQFWAVMEVNYEYNDERYFVDGSNLQRVFSSKSGAQEEARRLTVLTLMREGFDPFDYVDPDDYDHLHGADAYDELVGMPWLQWQDWLREHDVDPPETTRDQPSLVDLHAWWQTGVGGRTWQPGGYVTTPSLWDRAKRRSAVEHLTFDLYRIDDCSFGPPEPEVKDDGEGKEAAQ